MTHFHSSDERFCGSTAPARRFSLDPNEVSCGDCKNRDRFEISESGAAFLASLATPPPQKDK